jgi:cbb3-type cytochrome oxidase subunit 3
MTYDEAQYFSQMIAMGIFICLLGGVFFYAFRKANKSTFERAARAALDNDDTIKRR